MNVLVLCTGNSCRSQMAQGYLKQFAPDHNIYSAGVETHGLNPNAVKVMAEDGVDISGHTSNHVEEYDHVQFDHVITVCDHANEVCPVFNNALHQHHQNFLDPSHAEGSKEEIHQAYVDTRDEIKKWMDSFSRIHL